MLNLLNDRSREIFRLLVDAYCQSGEPVGSKILAEKMDLSLSTATIRNVMSQLEDLGLLYSPHPSAGRLPTEAGLRFFIDGLLEVGSLNSDDQQSLDRRCQPLGKSLPSFLEDSIRTLSNLSRCAGLVLAPKCESALKHIEFIALDPGRALVVLVSSDGIVENRIIEIPLGTPASRLAEATNFINGNFKGSTLREAFELIEVELKNRRAEIDSLVHLIVETGLGTWSGDIKTGQLIIHGQSQLLKDVEEWKDLERLQSLFEDLEAQERLVKILDACCHAEGIQIFIGASNSLFNHSGCSMVVAPYRNRRHQIVGAIGVIGPKHLNYARIIPMVDYMSQLLGRSLGCQTDN